MRAVLLILLCNVAVAGFGQAAYWQQQVNYDITVELNDADHTLTGYEQIEYFNHSPDSLPFIWFHLWPNAYKNDKTAFSDQLLENGSTDFYFSNNDKRGYINRLDFKVNGSVVRMEDHPQHQDIIKIVLTTPLAPGASCTIETPFHVKLPYNISRGGHKGQAYQITQWYPKAAVYDRKGWHPMPYLNQGEFYSEFGNYKVQIRVPTEYKIAATGEEVQANNTAATTTKQQLKTVVYKQNNVHDFAWFADKNFVAHKDTLALPSGKIINVAAYTIAWNDNEEIWRNAVRYIKKTVITRSNLMGEYPYENVSVVNVDVDYAGGMEYPTITAISGVRTEKELEGLVEHAVGHNWLYGILASNERDHPWMDEGINTYYGTRYWDKEVDINVRPLVKQKFLKDRMPGNMNFFSLYNVINEKTDQPIEGKSENFSGLNYDLSVYHKTSRWMQSLEKELGRALFDSCMHEYYRHWQFKHPYPEDLKKIFEEIGRRNLDYHFELLKKNGVVDINREILARHPSYADAFKRKTKFTSFFSFKDTDKYKYIFAAPIAGFNVYDKVMLGVVVHNYILPEERFQFLAAPMYATGSISLVGLARASYSWLPGNSIRKITIAGAASSFNGDDFTDSTGKRNPMRFSKIVPGIRIDFANKNPRSTIVKYLQWKTFFINEQTLSFLRDTINDVDVITYPTASRYFNQLRLVVENNRALYPYNAELQADQGKDFVRLAFTGNYFFNYAKGGGMNVRLFAGKFFYLGDRTYRKQFETDPYHLNMTGPKGYEDYGYSNYFIGRNEFDGFSSRQIMQRDGFFKVRTDLLGNKIGKSDNWLAAVNFLTDVPQAINPLQVLPIKIPFKIFVDVGSYAEAWQKDAAVGKFVYDAGVQFSLFKNILNIYVPLIYSKVYSDYFKSTVPGNRILNNIAFSIDIQNIKLKKLIPQLVF